MGPALSHNEDTAGDRWLRQRPAVFGVAELPSDQIWWPLTDVVGGDLLAAIAAGTAEETLHAMSNECAAAFDRLRDGCGDDGYGDGATTRFLMDGGRWDGAFDDEGDDGSVNNDDEAATVLRHFPATRRVLQALDLCATALGHVVLYRLPPGACHRDGYSDSNAALRVEIVLRNCDPPPAATATATTATATTATATTATATATATAAVDDEASSQSALFVGLDRRPYRPGAVYVYDATCVSQQRVVAAGDAPLWLLVADVWHPLLPPGDPHRAAVTQRFPPRVRPVAPSVPLPVSPWPWPSPFVDAPLRPSSSLDATVTVSVAVTATPSTLDTAALLARDRRLVDRWLIDAGDGPTSPLPVAFFAHDASTRSALRTVASMGGACGVVCFDATRPVYAHIEAQLSRLVTQLGADVVVVCVALHPPPPPSSSSSGGDDRSAVAQRVTRRFGRPTIDVDVVDADGRGHAAVLATLATLLVAQWRANGTWAVLVDHAANPPPSPVLKPSPLERPPRPFCIVS